MLAAIPGELIGLVIFAVAALLKWLGDRAAEQEVGKTPPPIPRREPRDTASSTRGDAETERKRRFMEALGMPADDLLGPRQETPPSLRSEAPVKTPARPREGRTKPIPPFVFQEPAPPVKRRPKPAVSTRSPAEPMAPPQRPFHEVPSLASPVATLQIAESQDDIASTGLALGDIADGTHGGAHVSALPSLREELHSAGALQRAVLLREILGPPMGLQSTNSLHSFRGP